MVVLGVDVGLTNCGYVICEVKKVDINIIAEDEIKPPRGYLLLQKLDIIWEVLEQQIVHYQPQCMIVENLYSHYKHPTTLGILSQIKGVVTLLAYKKGLSVFEYPPTRARKAFLGRGSGNALQVQKMAEHITGRTFKSIHTADAYSLVVAFSHTQKLKNIEIAVDIIR